MSTSNMDALFIMLHDRNHKIPSNLRIFGSDMVELSLEKALNYSYAVYPTKTTYIDMENEHCLSEKAILNQNLWQCLESYLDSTMNCRLPWRPKQIPQDLASCSHPKEYDQYYKNMAHLIKSGPNSIMNITRCTPGCNRYDYTAKLYKQWSYEGATSGIMEIDFFYHQHEVQVREHVYAYDFWNLISDFGGYLGLLLGYSLLAFYDASVVMVRKIMRVINQA